MYPSRYLETVVAPPAHQTAGGVASGIVFDSWVYWIYGCLWLSLSRCTHVGK
jgi:hypothetical protein